MLESLNCHGESETKVIILWLTRSETHCALGGAERDCRGE